MTQKLRIGILSTAAIGIEKVIPGMQQSDVVEVSAIASRSMEQARSAATKVGVAKAYGSYEELLADPDIDAIYNPLPNHLHIPWTLKAAEAGKHVLCEKPMGMNAKDVEALKSIDPSIVIMEAFMVRSHPQWLRAQALVQEGRIGKVQAVQTFFSYFNDDPANIRNDASIGGGALMDIGCYAVVGARMAFGADPIRVSSMIDRDPNFKTDRTTSGILDFGEGRQMTFTVSTQSVTYQRIHIVGTKGRIEIQIPFNAPLGEETSLYIDDGSDLRGRGMTTEIFEACDQYHLQGDAFARAVSKEWRDYPSVDDALINMRTLDALFKSAETNKWENI